MILSDDEYDSYYSVRLDSLSIQCTICLEYFPPSCSFLNTSSSIQTQCNHPVCNGCLASIISKHAACPECQVDYPVVANTVIAEHRCEHCNCLNELTSTGNFVCRECDVPICFMCGSSSCTGCGHNTWSRYRRHNGRVVRIGGLFNEEFGVSSHYTVRCSCGQEVSKAGACNEVSHCGCVCYYCGALTHPWEVRFPESHWKRCKRWDQLPCDALGCVQHYKECENHVTEIQEFHQSRLETSIELQNKRNEQENVDICN